MRLSRYKEIDKTDEPNINLLFDVILNYIKEENWIYGW